MTRTHALLAVLLAVPVLAQPRITGIATNVHAPYDLRVSDDGRRLVHRDGAPFFYLGDTAWELFHRTTPEEARRYLEDRARKGFTVIQAVVLAELDGLHTPSSIGHTPLHDDDPTRPNEAYFEHVDAVVDLADSLGLYVGLLPTWGDKFNLRWGVGPEVFTPENARAYGRFLGERYRHAPIIWILGGDRIPEEDADFAIIRAMAEGIDAATGGEHLMTYHPMGGRASWEFFGDDAWVDVHMFQSGHGAADQPNYARTAEGYARRPAKPVLDGEPRYEDHPIDWNPENGWFEAFDVRQALYWSVLAGAAGHTYGNHNIWQLWQPGREPISSARTPWTAALDHAGAAQVGHGSRLFRSRPFLGLVPDQSLIQNENPEDGGHQRAARAADGSYLIAYSPYGRPLTLDLRSLSGAALRVWWFDPRTGQAEDVGRFDKPASRTFDPPGAAARGNDWVLVIDDAARNYIRPGSGAY